MTEFHTSGNEAFDIRGLREALHMTQEQLAHAICVTVSSVNRWENNHAKPSRLALRALRDLRDEALAEADAA